MHASNATEEELISGINVTPLVDVVLVLLVILMVTATTLVSRTIPVDLPRGSTGENTHVMLAITLDAKGKTFLDAKPVSDELLRKRVRGARSGDPELRSTIAADGSVPHRRVVQVVDLLRQEGVTRFALNVQPEDVHAQ